MILHQNNLHRALLGTVHILRNQFFGLFQAYRARNLKDYMVELKKSESWKL